MHAITKYIMNKFDQKVLCLNHLSVAEDLCKYIKTFLYYDKRELLKTHKQNMSNVLFCIDNAISRKNGFGFMEEDETDIDHWSFGIEDDTNMLQLQATSCMQCGQYVCTGRLDWIDLNNNLRCYCIVDNFMDDEEDEFEDDIQEDINL